MKRLRMTVVLSIAFGLMALSSVVAIWQVTASLNGSIHMAERERLGVAYLQQMLPVEEALPADRRLAGAPGRTANPAYSALEGRLDRGIAALDEFDRHNGNVLQTTEDMVGMRDAWRGRAEAPDAVQVRRQIESRLETLEQLVGDTSELTLDPVLDSYYLADATVANLPATRHLVNRLLDEVDAAGGHPPDQATRPSLIATVALLQASLVRVGTDYRVAVEGNAALGPALNEPVRVFRQRVTAAIDLVNAHLNVPPGQAAMPDGLAPALQKVLDAGFVLERTSLPTLDGLLRSRAEATRHDRDHTLKIVLALLAAGLLLGAGAMWSFTRRLRHAAQAIGAADVGQTEALEKEAGGDEVGDVVGAAAGLLRRLGSAAGARPASAASGHETPPAESLADENHQLKLLVAELSLANRFGQEDA